VSDLAGVVCKRQRYEADGRSEDGVKIRPLHPFSSFNPISIPVMVGRLIRVQFPRRQPRDVPITSTDLPCRVYKLTRIGGFHRSMTLRWTSDSKPSYEKREARELRTLNGKRRATGSTN